MASSHHGTIPATEKSRLTVKVGGSSVSNAVFRADVKKELTFFRGCGGVFKHDSVEDDDM